MTILHPEPIIEKLEKDGVETVKAKKAKGLYRKEKLELIDKWLASKAAGVKKTVLTDPGEEPALTKVDLGLDKETLRLANMDDEAYKAADSKIKRKITMARKKVKAAIKAADEKDETLETPTD